MNKIIDAHIHLDKYENEDIPKVLADVESVVSVSFDLESCKRNHALSVEFPKVKPAFGLHPEQVLPSELQLEELIYWIKLYQHKSVAIGEVGLPYYLKKKGKLSCSFEQYTECLEVFIKLAKELDKPIVLHCVYEDAKTACKLLEKHSIKKAHFHWFKGDSQTISRMAENGYFISLTPDLLYEEDIQALADVYPLQQIMVETDGPWPFEGPFIGKLTRPSMVHSSIEKLSFLKRLEADVIYEQIYSNTKEFFGI